MNGESACHFACRNCRPSSRGERRVQQRRDLKRAVDSPSRGRARFIVDKPSRHAEKMKNGKRRGELVAGSRRLMPWRPTFRSGVDKQPYCTTGAERGVGFRSPSPSFSVGRWRGSSVRHRRVIGLSCSSAVKGARVQRRQHPHLPEPAFDYQHGPASVVGHRQLPLLVIRSGRRSHQGVVTVGVGSNTIKSVVAYE